MNADWSINIFFYQCCTLETLRRGETAPE